MRPIVLQGHTRPLTRVKFNREGDLFFTTAKDKAASVWYTSTGERLGTLNGHNGVIWDLDVDWNTTRAVTVSGDQTSKLWDVSNGKCLYTWDFKAPVRAVCFSPGDRVVAMAQTNQMATEKPEVFLYRLNEESTQQSTSSYLRLSGYSSNVIRILWYPTGEFILTAMEDGSVKKWDAETGVEIASANLHSKSINDCQWGPNQLMFITASSDSSAKLVDTKSFQVLKEYKTDRPVNSASVSPILPHVLLGGGQEASRVTTTTDRAGKFESLFYHMIYENELGRVRGHFGPINTIAFSPDGKSFASGAEEGFVRLHSLDPEYFTKNYD